MAATDKALGVPLDLLPEGPRVSWLVRTTTYVGQFICAIAYGVTTAATILVTLRYVDDQFYPLVPWGRTLALTIAALGFGVASCFTGLIVLLRKQRER
ncbi:MAG: hypothetical protein U0514_00790 [Candidatus Andersenbacteria bacterium]